MNVIHTTENIYDFTLLQDKTPVIFTVGGHSQIITIEPITGDTLTEADSFELRRVIEPSAPRSIKQFHLDKTAILLGATLTQYEIVIKGNYIIDKILNTTESTAAFRTIGTIKTT